MEVITRTPIQCGDNTEEHENHCFSALLFLVAGISGFAITKYPSPLIRGFPEPGMTSKWRRTNFHSLMEPGLNTYRRLSTTPFPPAPFIEATLSTAPIRS